MAAMFRDFSFEARHPAAVDVATDRAAMNVSPTTMQPAEYFAPLPPTSSSLGDLVDIFDQQTLQVNVDLDPSYDIPSADESVEPYSRVSTAALRMQRQTNTRLQCRTSHVKDLRVLVQKMVEEDDQCQVSDSTSPTSTSSTSETASLSTTTTTTTTTTTSVSDEDEGVDMEYNSPNPEDGRFYALKFRRSGERLPGCSAVSKTARMRKKPRAIKRMWR